MTRDELLAAETCRFGAWPAAHNVDLSGWILRATSGGYSRTNSVWPARFTNEISLPNAIDQAESFFRDRGLPPQFQVLEIAQPEGLDSELDRRGYAVETPCLTMAKAIAADFAEVDAEIAGDETPDWIGVYLFGQSVAKARECPQILALVPPPRAFVTCRIHGTPAGVGLGVKVGRNVSIDCMATVPAHRRHGAAATVLKTLEQWAHKQGARHLVLSVVTENEPALGLYRKLGFEKITGYHYRVLGTAQA